MSIRSHLWWMLYLNSWKIARFDTYSLSCLREDSHSSIVRLKSKQNCFKCRIIWPLTTATDSVHVNRPRKNLNRKSTADSYRTVLCIVCSSSQHHHPNRRMWWHTRCLCLSASIFFSHSDNGRHTEKDARQWDRSGPENVPFVVFERI